MALLTKDRTRLFLDSTHILNLGIMRDIIASILVDWLQSKQLHRHAGIHVSQVSPCFLLVDLVVYVMLDWTLMMSIMDKLKQVLRLSSNSGC